MHHDGFKDAKSALDFILAGRARVTLTSLKTGDHYTYRVSRKTREGGPSYETTPWFVSVLSGPDNGSDYNYIGFIPKQGPGDGLVAGQKGRPDATSFKAFQWALSKLVGGSIPSELRIQHEGSCCRCGRALTHPDSVESGVGPECARKMEAA